MREPQMAPSSPAMGALALVPPAGSAVEMVRAVPVARLALGARSVTRLAFLGITTAGALADATDDALLSAAATDDAALETLMRVRWMVRRWIAALGEEG